MSLGKEAERVARTAHNQGGKLALAKLVDRNVKWKDKHKYDMLHEAW